MIPFNMRHLPERHPPQSGSARREHSPSECASSTAPKPRAMFACQAQGFLCRTLIRSQHVLPIAFFLLLFCFLPISVASDEEAPTWDWEPDKFPNLKREPKFCTGAIRNPPTSICDPDMTLSREEAFELDKLIDSENVTTCICDSCSKEDKKGLVIKVAVLMMLKKRENQTLDETIEQFAERTRTNWNFSPKCHNDVLVFICTTYNKVYISLGARAARVVSESDAEEIVKSTMTHIKYGNVHQALESIITSLKHRAQQYDPRFDRFRIKHGLMITIGAALASLIVIVLAVWFCIRRETKRTRKQWINNGISHGATTRTSIAEKSPDYQQVKMTEA